jgi:hypothetical protein
MGEKSSQILSTAGVKVLSNAVTAHCGTERKLFLRKSSPLRPVTVYIRPVL